MCGMFINHDKINLSSNYLATFHYKCVVLITYNYDNISRQYFRVRNFSILLRGTICITTIRFNAPDFGFTYMFIVLNNKRAV